jgi:hypothetical protein
MYWLAGMRLTAIALAAFTWPNAMHGAESSEEDTIKAAFVYNFTKFVQWPPDRFPNADSAILIGVLGDKAFCGRLENVVRDRRVNGRGISVVDLRSIDDAASVHVLVVRAGQERRFGMTAPAKLAGVLTVGESADFAAREGIVNFTMADEKVRFEINADAADRAELKISAQLQKLASTVRKKL